MKLKSLVTVLATAGALTLSATATVSQSHPERDVQFICAQSRRTNVPTTYAWTRRGKIAVVRWQSRLSDYSPQRRCEEVSPRFQTAYNNGSLSFITNGTINRQRVICTAREVEGACANLLLTLRPQDEPYSTLEQLNQILNGEIVGPVVQNSKPQVYIQIDIEKFLRSAPVEKE